MGPGFITTFHSLSKEGTGVSTDLPSFFVIETVFLFPVIQTFSQINMEAYHDGLFT
jgi:hypothetical protein